MEKQDNNFKHTTTYLFSMVGHAGSGKSFFARELASSYDWVRLNGDSMRMALFGSLEEIKKQPVQFRRIGIFKAVDYAAEQVLQAKKSVIYDANNNKRSIRDEHTKTAQQFGAEHVVVWLKTSKEVAIERTKAREASVDQRKFDHNSAVEVVERHIQNLDEPTDNEKVIVLDGEDSLQRQLESFATQLQELGK